MKRRRPGTIIDQAEPPLFWLLSIVIRYPVVFIQQTDAETAIRSLRAASIQAR